MSARGDSPKDTKLIVSAPAQSEKAKLVKAIADIRREQDLLGETFAPIARKLLDNYLAHLRGRLGSDKIK